MLKEDCTDILFRYAVDILHWYVHRRDPKKTEEGGAVSPPPQPPEPPNPGSGIDAPVDLP